MDTKLATILRRLREYDPEKVILFGSRSRGASDRYSDYDLVIIKKTRKRFLDRIKEVIQIIKPNYATDIFVYTPREFQRMIAEENPFLQHVLKEGKVIYEKS